MSDCFDHEGDAWASLEDALMHGDGPSPYYRPHSYSRRDPRTQPKKKKVICAFCGKKKLRWRFLLATGSWRLVTKKGNQHVCQEYLEKQRKKRVKFCHPKK